MISSVNIDGLDLRQFNRELVAYLRALLLIKAGSAEAVDLTTEDIAELQALAAKASLEQILRATKLFGQLELGLDNYSALPLELALVDCTLTSEEEKKVQPRQTETEVRPPPKAVTPPQTPTHSSPPQAKPAPAKLAPAKVTAPPAPVMAAAVTTPLQGGTEIERLRLNWRLIIEQAPPDTQKTTAMALLRSAGVRPVVVENDTVSLSFRFPVHKEQIEKLENQRVVEKIISNFLGRPCRVHCILEDNHLLKEALKIGKIIDVEEK